MIERFYSVRWDGDSFAIATADSADLYFELALEFLSLGQTVAKILAAKQVF